MENYSHQIDSAAQTLVNPTEAHAISSHGAVHEAHELPNWISIFTSHFPDHPASDFLHRWENVIFSLTIALFISGVGIIAARKKNRVPQGIQNLCEAVVEGLETFVTGILGEAGRKHVPFLGTIFLYILFMNWFGLFPFMKSPTAAWSTTLALALTTMVYVQLTGMMGQGFTQVKLPFFKRRFLFPAYLIHLMGNPKGIFGIMVIPLMLVLNIILEFGAVPFSLSLRLFANISSEDRLLLNFAELALSSKFLAFPFQIFANLLALIFSLVQAFVFMLLSTVYIALVLPHDEHHEHEEIVSGHAH
ncbi:MAG: F0F1 ATP synthase subunit A [Candidatus Omnitrophica bacterium]|nr:F0F1 ATP synthase subunit A [Candidatus Omnitrophota bacterium]